MEIDLTGVVIIVGNFGSGKTEVSINLAVYNKKAGIDVRVADLDIVNPYFRTREAAAPLSKLDIEVVLPPKEYLQADLPIVSPVVAGMIKQPNTLTLIDVGGDDVGATVLASLADAFKNQKVKMIQVVNPLRPFTGSIKGCLKIQKEIETASKMTITGLVGNANLIDETNAAHIINGHDFVRNLSRESGLPLEFITAPREILSELDKKQFSCPVLPIDRQLVPPWKKAAELNRN